MSLTILQNQPIVSLNPVVTSTFTTNTVSLVPTIAQIMVNPNTIFYDPTFSYNTVFPNQAYYVEYPDLNTDINLQKKVFNELWNKLESKWIYDFTKVFKFVVGTKGNYRLAKSASEAENNTINNEEIYDKIDWILCNFYKKSDLIKTIDKFRNNLKINLWDIKDYHDEFKSFVYHQMKRKFLNSITN